MKQLNNLHYCELIRNIFSVQEKFQYSGLPGGECWGVQQPPPPQIRKIPPKSCQTQPDCENCYKLMNLGRQHPKLFGKIQ